MTTYTGTWAHDVFVGTSGNDTFVGIAGGDTVDGGAGDDTISIDLGYTDIAVSYNAMAAATAAGTSPLWYMSVKNVEHLGTLITGGGNDSLTISYAQGNFTWDAGAGDDTLKLDYSAAISNVVMLDTANGISITASGAGGQVSHIEHVQLVGSKLGDQLIGTAGSDIISGGDGDDYIDTRGGKDIIDGGAGYDSVTLNSYWAAGTTNVVYDATKAATATGFTLYDGTVIKSVEGLTSLTTGDGNDTLYITATQKIFTWIANGGTDTLYADFSAATGAITVTEVTGTPLGVDLRFVTPGMQIHQNSNVYGIESAHIIGSAFADTLHGTAGNDVLNGGKGADVMTGGTGDDTYYVDSAMDIVTEASGEGTDTIISSITFGLAGTFVENLTLSGANAWNATGNSLSNVLTGNSLDNILDGGTGADTMIGGLGNDRYIVDNTGDVVVELANQGNDEIFSSVSYSLAGGFVEQLYLTGTANLTATGNAFDNIIKGNDGNNVINGGGGKDTLIGGLGADTFLFNAASVDATVYDFSTSQGDKIDIHAYTHGVITAACITQAGTEVHIDLGGGNIICVNNAIVADVTSHVIW